MRIEQISVTRFGPLRDLDLRFALPPAGGLVVIEGPNEAGKTTLLRFVRALLFGSEPAEGALVVHYDGTRYRIAQRGKRSTVVVTDLESGRPVGANVLQRIVGNLDAGVYRQIFAFGLAELQQLKTLTGEGVQERIFSAAVAGAGQSVREVQRGLGHEIDQLWRPRGDCKVRGAANDLKGILKDLQDADRSASGYEDLLRDEGRLAADIQASETNIAALRNDLHRHEILIEFKDRWHARLEAQAGLAASPAVEGLTTDAPQQLQSLRDQADLLKRHAPPRAEIERLEREASAAVPDEPLLAEADVVHEVAASVQLQRQRVQEDLPTLLGERDQAEQTLAVSLAALGEGWTEEDLSTFSLPSSVEIEKFRDDFASRKEKRLQCGATAEGRATSLEEAGSLVASLLSAGAEERWLEAADAIRELHDSSSAYALRSEHLAQMRQNARDAKGRLAAVLLPLGGAWDEAKVAAFASDDAWLRRAKEGKSALSEAVDLRHRRQAAYDATERHVEALRNELDLLRKPECSAADAVKALEDLNGRIGRLERLFGTYQEWRQSEQEKQAAELGFARVKAAERAQGGWIAVTVSFVLPLALAAVLYQRTPLAAVGLVLTAAILAAVNWPRRGARGSSEFSLAVAERALDEAMRRERSLAQRASEEGKSVGLGDVDLGRINEALVQVRSQAESLGREVTLAQQWEQSNNAFQQTQKGLEESRVHLVDAQQAEADQLTSWHAWCAANGVPDHVEPADLAGFLVALDRARELAHEEGLARHNADATGASLKEWEDAILALAERFDVDQALGPEQCIEAMQVEMDRALALRDARKALGEAERHDAEAARALQQAEDDVAELRAGWDAWCSDHGLPPMAATEDARLWLRDEGTARESMQQVRKLRAKCRAASRRIAEWEADASTLLAKVGRSVPGSGADLVRAIEQLQKDCDEAKAQVAARESARGQLAQAKQKLAEASTQIEEKEDAATEILTNCGVQTEAELRERLELQGKRVEWQRTIEASASELRRRTGKDAEAFAYWLDENDPLRWEEERDQIRTHLQRAEQQLNDTSDGLRTKLGGLRTRRQDLEASGKVATLRLAAEQRKAELAQLVRQLVVHRLADALIGDTLKEYENTHVPDVLRLAAGHLMEVTGGRYVGIHALEKGQLRVATAGNDVLDSALLSQGTQEQLYFVVRLGLVDSFAQQSEPLPLVLDDVLVNADPERQDGMIRALVRASRDHQALFLTCHPDESRAILAHIPDAQLVHLGQIATSGAVDAAQIGTNTNDAGTEGGRDDSTLVERVIRSLREHANGATASQMCALLGVDSATLREVMMPFVRSGVVIREGRTRGTRYRMTEMPVE